MEITLYYTHHTRALRPRWLLEELEQPYRLQLIDIFGDDARAREYRDIHPHGSVPAIDIDGHVMIESGAICHWLADRFPEKGFAPAITEPARMDYEQWMFYLPGTLEPLPFQILLHGTILPQQYRVPEMVPWASKRYLGLLKYLNRVMETQTWLVADRFSAADIMIGSTLMWLPDMLKKYPALVDYCERLKLRPAFERASADPAGDAS